MKFARHIVAALALLAWLFASAHVTLEHGGEGLAAAAAVENDDHHHHGDAHGHDHEHDSVPAHDTEHRHDLTGVVAGQFLQSLTAPGFVAICLPMFGSFAEGLGVLKLRPTAEHERSMGESPPDERASGWLLVVHTARPVRGPSLTA